MDLKSVQNLFYWLKKLENKKKVVQPSPYCIFKLLYLFIKL